MRMSGLLRGLCYTVCLTKDNIGHRADDSKARYRSCVALLWSIRVRPIQHAPTNPALREEGTDLLANASRCVLGREVSGPRQGQEVRHWQERPQSRALAAKVGL